VCGERFVYSVTLQEISEQTVIGLGYDLVEIERTTGGLLRISIDVPWTAEAKVNAFDALTITVEDCEKVTRQLQYLFEVEDIAYSRLEVSSPGIDRLLRNHDDFERFKGRVIDIVLKEAIGSSATADVSANRKKFRGTLERSESTDSLMWRITWRDEPDIKKGQRISKHRESPPLLCMDFQLNELKEARLAPIVNFKGGWQDLPSTQSETNSFSGDTKNES
jgi:ribosome maturation factor RimP